ncbi:MAG: hypothetical protein IJZ73_06035 [Clostridia bacterium]|nr:hypothetical protein [Clostridia bacterium]
MITKEQVWKGLRLELSYEELGKIDQCGNYERDDYYDFDLLMSTLYKMLNREIDFKHFLSWCILIANCFSYIKFSNSKLNHLYCDIGWFFDGISFMDEYNKLRLLESIAMLKHYDYLVNKAKKKTKKPFTTNGVERILCFDHANWNYDSSVYKVIIKDYNTQEWEIRYFDDYNFEYDENINYSFVDDTEFANIFSEFYNEKTKWKEIHNMNF